MSDPAAPTPERIFQTTNAFQSSAALEGAVELGLFTALGGESRTAASLAEAIGAAERGVRILCDFLSIGGLLEKEGMEYRSAPDAAMFLDESSPAYMGPVVSFLLAPDLAGNYADIAGLVRRGGTLLEGDGTMEPDNPLWVDFARAMVPLMQPSAEFIGELVTKDADPEAPFKVLDIAAGHGIFGIQIATRHPRAEIVALDSPGVLEVAAENAGRFGVSDRHTRLPGSAFDVELGNGYDVVLLTNFFHHFDIPTCTDLMRKVRGALNPGGRAVTLEFVPNEDRVTPPEQASFSLVMLATTPSGDAYTFDQYEGMFREAGFEKSELHRLQGPPQSVIVSTK